MTRRNLLRHEASCYMSEIDMTKSDRQDLLVWINDGHSAFDNPWYMADGNGRVMDYISAKREVYELSQLHSSNGDI